MLVVQRDDDFTALAISGGALQSARGLREKLDRAIAINGVAGLREIPTAALVRRFCGGGDWLGANGWSEVRGGKGK